MRPFCPECRVWMRCERNDVRVAELSEPVATARQGDLYGCPICHARVVTGFGQPFYVQTAQANADFAVRGE